LSSPPTAKPPALTVAAMDMIALGWAGLSEAGGEHTDVERTSGRPSEGTITGTAEIDSTTSLPPTSSHGARVYMTKATC